MMVEKDLSIPKRLINFLKDKKAGTTFIYEDFKSCGPYSPVRSAVVFLCKTRKLARVCQGVYVKPGNNGKYEIPSNCQIIKELDRRNGGIPMPKDKETTAYISGQLSYNPKILSFYTNSSTRRFKLPDGTLVKFYHRDFRDF